MEARTKWSSTADRWTRREVVGQLLHVATASVAVLLLEVGLVLHVLDQLVVLIQVVLVRVVGLEHGLDLLVEIVLLLEHVLV